MVSFHEVRFPYDISYGSTGGAEYSTDILELVSGYEKRNSNWSQSRGRWNAAHGVRTSTQLSALIHFFRARKGRAYGFRFRDWTDYKLQSENIGTGDGVETEFQITKTYTSGGYTDVRNITKIVNDSDASAIATAINGSYTAWSVLVNGVLQTEGAMDDYTVDRDTGVITFNSAVTDTHVITVNGEFDIPARFDTDSMSVNIEHYENYSWNSIPIIEIRV